MTNAPKPTSFPYHIPVAMLVGAIVVSIFVTVTTTKETQRAVEEIKLATAPSDLATAPSLDYWCSYQTDAHGEPTSFGDVALGISQPVNPLQLQVLCGSDEKIVVATVTQSGRLVRSETILRTLEYYKSQRALYLSGYSIVLSTKLANSCPDGQGGLMAPYAVFATDAGYFNLKKTIYRGNQLCLEEGDLVLYGPWFNGWKEIGRWPNFTPAIAQKETP